MDTVSRRVSESRSRFATRDTSLVRGYLPFWVGTRAAFWRCGKLPTASRRAKKLRSCCKSTVFLEAPECVYTQCGVVSRGPIWYVLPHAPDCTANKAPDFFPSLHDRVSRHVGLIRLSPVQSAPQPSPPAFQNSSMATTSHVHLAAQPATTKRRRAERSPDTARQCERRTRERPKTLS
jgi:hypothetical protein